MPHEDDCEHGNRPGELPGHSTEAIRASLQAIDLTLDHILRRLAAIDKQMSGGASAAELELILKELAENRAKLKSAQQPTPAQS